jgi:hypothetical protein
MQYGWIQDLKKSSKFGQHFSTETVIHLETFWPIISVIQYCHIPKQKLNLKWFWRWYMIYGTICFLDFIHRLFSHRTQRFGECLCVPVFRWWDEEDLLSWARVQWLRVALSDVPNWVGLLHIITWRQGQSQSPKCCVLWLKIDG